MRTVSFYMISSTFIYLFLFKFVVQFIGRIKLLNLFFKRSIGRQAGGGGWGFVDGNLLFRPRTGQ
jgi:hypothetical protein